MNDYTLDFKGYKLQGHESTFEHQSGIYCVYRCVYDANRNTVSLRELIYIGRADDFNQRHQDHEKKGDWIALLKPGEMLCYSRAELAKSSLEVCEAAMIFVCDPICNRSATKAFHHGETCVHVRGAHGLIASEIHVDSGL